MKTNDISVQIIMLKCSALYIIGSMDEGVLHYVYVLIDMEY